MNLHHLHYTHLYTCIHTHTHTQAPMVLCFYYGTAHAHICKNIEVILN